MYNRKIDPLNQKVAEYYGIAPEDVSPEHIKQFVAQVMKQIVMSHQPKESVEDNLFGKVDLEYVQQNNILQ